LIILAPYIPWNDGSQFIRPENMHQCFGWRVAEMDVAPQEGDNNTDLNNKSEHKDWEGADWT
jgi:hypothetical protein